MSAPRVGVRRRGGAGEASAFLLSGGGNDFIALVEPAREPTEGEIRGWCARGRSVGADGLFLLRRAAAGAVRMTYFNADGGEAALCLNGVRCAARLAFHLGWSVGRVEVETGAGPVAAAAAGGGGLAVAPPPPGEPPRRLAPEVDGRTVEGWAVRVGVPHFVLFLDAVADAPVAALGPTLRAHPAFGDAGTNVDFVALPGDGEMEIRSWERGVEAETLACGTGVLAAAAAAVAAGRAVLPLTALTRGGFRFAVGGEVEDRRISRWTLAGDARMLAELTLHPGALELPEPPDWR